MASIATLRDAVLIASSADVVLRSTTDQTLRQAFEVLNQRVMQTGSESHARMARRLADEINRRAAR